MNYYTQKLVSLVLFCLFTSVSVQAQTTFVVNSTADDIDSNLGDSICDTGNLLPDGVTAECTLRAAIGDLSTAPNGAGNNIDFNINTDDPNHDAGVWTISPASALPAIDFPVILSTNTQAGFNCPSFALGIAAPVVIDGSGTPAGTDGLNLSGNNAQTVEGFAIVNFPRDGIAISGIAVKLIRCNFIGIDQDGDTIMPNGDDGLDFANFVNGTTVYKNVISGNGGAGIEHAILFDGDETWIHSNIIGLDGTALLDRGNVSSGISLFGTKTVSIGVAPPGFDDTDQKNLGLSTGNFIS